MSQASLSPSTPKRSSFAVDTLKLRNDRLGTLVRDLTSKFLAADSWESFVNEFRGRSYLSPKLDGVEHPAAPLLREWRDNGVPVLTSDEPWTDELKDTRFERGCHKSANDHADFLREEFSEFIESKFWVLLPYRLVRHFENLQLSPAAVKDERDRKPRLLSDHTWYTTNELTLPHAPPEAMQFAGALPRLLTNIRRANPRYGPIRLAKHDVKDGFYRMFLNPSHCMRLTLVAPRYEGEEPLVAIPMSCTMGWVQSPPTFCAMSETAADVARLAIEADPRGGLPHRLSEIAATHDDLSENPKAEPRESEDLEASRRLAALAPRAILPPSTGLSDIPIPVCNDLLHKPLAETEVFVDDFIQAAQGSPQRMVSIRNHLLHSVDRVLARPLPDEPHRNETISRKKTLKGDGSWRTRKVILGWVIDTVRCSLELPPHRKTLLANLFDDLLSKNRVSVREWQRALGQLRFVSLGVPGAIGLFSVMQQALNDAKGWVPIDRHLRLHLEEFAALAADLCSRPTYLPEIIPERPKFFGASDAAKQGMGGVFFDSSGQPVVWRWPFPQVVQDRLVSAAHRDGDITNSDLEQAGILGQAECARVFGGLTYATLETLSDNTPAVSRFVKGATSSRSAAAYLCRLASRHRRAHRYCHNVSYIPGDANSMADAASRTQHLSDPELLALFEQRYPQEKPWQLVHLPTAMTSSLTSSLLCRLQTSLAPGEPSPIKTASSAVGPDSAPPMASPNPFATSRIPTKRSATSSSSACGSAAVAAAENLSELERWRTPSWPWARGYPTWVSRIPASRFLDHPPTIHYSKLSSRPCATKTTPPVVSTRQTSPSSALSPSSSTSTTLTKASPRPPSSTSSSSLSSGSCDPLSTRISQILRMPVVLKPFGSATSSSMSPADSVSPPTRLVMTPRFLPAAALC